MRISVRMIFFVAPVPVLYVARLAEGVAGEARGPVVRIRHDYERDEGLLQHELEHVRQFWRAAVVAGLVLTLLAAALFEAFGIAISLGHVALFAVPLGLCAHPACYLAFRGCRAQSEGSAYLVQMRHVDRRGGFLSLPAAAERLASPRYRLGISAAAARAYLRALS